MSTAIARINTVPQIRLHIHIPHSSLYFFRTNLSNIYMKAVHPHSAATTKISQSLPTIRRNKPPIGSTCDAYLLSISPIAINSVLIIDIKSIYCFNPYISRNAYNGRKSTMTPIVKYALSLFPVTSANNDRITVKTYHDFLAIFLSLTNNVVLIPNISAT